MPAGEIERLVEDALSAEYSARHPDSRLDIRVNPINATLNFERCHTAPEIQIPFSSGQRVTARVLCHQPNWSLFVTAQVRQMLPVVVSSRPLPRHSRIGHGDVRLLDQDISRLGSDYFTRLEDVVGLQLRRPIGSDQIINNRHVEEAMTVQRGDAVAIEAQRGSLTIRASGVALEDGRTDQQIRVRNDSSGTEVRAVVIAPGLVRVP